MCIFSQIVKKNPFSLYKAASDVFKMPALGGDHQRFSVERSFALDPENWVAQIESRKKGIQARAWFEGRVMTKRER